MNCNKYFSEKLGKNFGLKKITGPNLLRLQKNYVYKNFGSEKFRHRKKNLPKNKEIVSLNFFGPQKLLV